MCCRNYTPLGSTSQATLQLSCLGIGPLQLCPGSRAQVGIQPCHLACSLQSDGDSYRESFVPIGNLPAWSQARPAESPSCLCYFGIEGKIWLQKPFTSSLQTWFHTFCLKSSSLLSVAPKIFRKVTTGHPTWAQFDVANRPPSTLPTSRHWGSSLTRLLSALLVCLLARTRHKADVAFPKSVVGQRKLQHSCWDQKHSSALQSIISHHHYFAPSNFPTVYL